MDPRAQQTDWFSRPGDSLIAAMNRRGLKSTDVARHLQGGLEQLRGYVSGDLSIDDTAAAALSYAVGGSKAFWLSRQANYERDLQRAIEAVPENEVGIWLEQIPSPRPKPRGRVTESARQLELRHRLSFFGVSTLGAWDRRYSGDRSRTLFRTSAAFESVDGAISLWLRQGELEACIADTARWDLEVLKSQIQEIKGLSRIAKPARFLPRLKELLSRAGVALVVRRAPKDCKASGASRFVRPDRAMLLVSFRYRSDDQFWFTVFHELGHLMLHGFESFVDTDGMPEDNRESEANNFATSMIVPLDRWPEFENLRTEHRSVTRFAVSVGVSPGLIVGQLQHRARLSLDRLAFLKRRWTWDEIDAATAIL